MTTTYSQISTCTFKALLISQIYDDITLTQMYDDLYQQVPKKKSHHNLKLNLSVQLINFFFSYYFFRAPELHSNILPSVPSTVMHPRKHKFVTNRTKTSNTASANVNGELYCHLQDPRSVAPHWTLSDAPIYF